MGLFVCLIGGRANRLGEQTRYRTEKRNTKNNLRKCWTITLINAFE